MIFYDKTSQSIAIGLAFLAGMIDALGFISLGGVFVSFMSGNSTRFSVYLAEGAPILALIPLLIITLFVAGVMAGWIIRHLCPHKPSTAVLSSTLIVLTSAAIFYELEMKNIALYFLPVSMGLSNNVFVQKGEVSIGVTYMTGTLVKFGQRLAGRLMGERDNNWLPYLLLWTGLSSGALCGAIGYAALGLHTLWTGIIICLLLTILLAKAERLQ